MNKHKLVKKILFNNKSINNKIIELAKIVDNYYKNYTKSIILIGILKGCLPFLSQFMLKLTIDCSIHLIYLKSYFGNIKPIIKPKIMMNIINDNIKNQDLLIIDDIIDSGNSLFKIRNYFQKIGAKSIKIIVLLNKKSKRISKIEADWYGFEVPDYFLVGYGLDYNEKLRNLPYIGIADLKKIEILNIKKS